MIGTRQLPLPDGSVYDIDGEWATIQNASAAVCGAGDEITPQTTSIATGSPIALA